MALCRCLSQEGVTYSVGPEEHNNYVLARIGIVMWDVYCGLFPSRLPVYTLWFCMNYSTAVG